MINPAAIARPVERYDPAGKARVSGIWVVAFILFQFAMQLALLVPGLGSARVLPRVGGFGASLLLLVILPPRGSLRLVKPWVIAILAILGLELLNPESGGALPAIAELMLNLAIVGPVFWVPRAAVTPRSFRWLINSFWLYYSLSAALGVAQAYFPGRFQPPLSAIVAAHGRGQVASLQIQLASGERVFRPMGLTDTPGGASYAALYAILLGTGVLLLPKPPFPGARIAAVGSMMVGMMCLYLCQVRSVLVMVGICVITMIGVLSVSGRVSRAVGLLVTSAVVIPVSFVFAFALGGEGITKRLSTLVESDAGSVYYAHRGRFLEQAIYEILPRYPLGAGLGRWGMVCHYFGSMADALYVEIQWTGWIFDGGMPLVLVYCSAIVATSWYCLRIAQGHVAPNHTSLEVWAAVVVAYNVGALALCFNYPVFISTAGLEFWLLNAALISAAQNLKQGFVPNAAL